MAGSGNLFVVDEEFLARGGELASHRNFFSEVLEEYIQIMDCLTANIEGNTATAIADMVNSMRSIPSEIVATGSSFQTDCEAFVDQIDEADSFLY